MDDITGADFLLVASNVDSMFVPPPSFTSEQLISYTENPTKLADWHLHRSATKAPPSILDFMSLIKDVSTSITQVTTKSTEIFNEADTLKKQMLATTPSDEKNRLKILIVGNLGSGKSTAIHCLSKNAFSTDVKPSDGTQNQKKTTTVGMDFGTLSVDDETQLMLYGAPGQRRFEFMSDVLECNALGLIILINNESSNPLSDLYYYLDKHREFLLTRPAVIGVTHNDISPQPALKAYQELVATKGGAWPVFKVDARRQSDMRQLIDTLRDSNLWKYPFR